MNTQHSIIAEEQLNGFIENDGIIGGQVQTHGTVSGVVNYEKQHQIGIVHIKDNIEGIIQQKNNLSGVINNNNNLIGSINYHTEGGSDVPPYEGEYVVTPRIYEQSLATKNKLMKADVKVKEIPYYETSNISGKTVYIGGE